MGKPPRIERKIIEKNRRNKMKNLYSQLLSLLPNPDKVVEGATLPDQIDEAVEHIKNMKTKLQKLRHKKELLLQSNHHSCIRNYENQALIEVEVQDMGPNLDVVLVNGLQNYSTFRHIVKLLLHQSEGVQIATANFANSSCCSIQLLHDKPKSGLDGATISRKLKEALMVSRGASSTSEQVESQHNLEYSNYNWGFEIPEVLLPGLQEYIITINKSTSN